MELTIENFRGIKRATIQLSNKITLIAGCNGSGKTSIIQALQALVTGETMPFPDLKKKDAKALVFNYADFSVGNSNTASASLKWVDGNAAIKWPACKATGTTFKCSAYAAALLLPTTIPAKDLTRILDILPTEDDFNKEMSGFGVNTPTQQIWETIKRVGWDAANTQAEEKRRDLKRDWEKLSGQNWGSSQSALFTPEHFTGQPLEELKIALQTAEKLFEHAIKAETLDQKERQDLQKLVGEHDGVKQSITEFTKQITDLNVEIAKAQGLLQQIPSIINQQQAYECWNCNKLGIIKDGKLIEAPDMKAAEQDATANKLRIAEQNKILTELKEKRDNITLSQREAQTHASRCEDAKKRLNTIVLDTPAPILSVDDARAEVELCKKRIAAHKTKNECDEIHEALGLSNYVCAVLNPEGLRKQVLSTRLASFNDLLSVICETADWPKISLDEYLDFRFDGRPYPLLSMGEKFAVNAALQLALVKMDESKIIILDGVDVLDKRMRNGLINILDNIPIPSVIACTFNNSDEVPNLGDLGSSYWCEDGRVSPAFITQNRGMVPA